MEMNTNELPKNSEQWASIDGYKNYQVSWWGRVRNATTARILKGSLSSNGYLTVGLSKNRKPKTHYIHQLVAREWVSNPEEKRCIDHIDGSRSNNHWENLRYATHSENNRNTKKRSDCSSVYKGVSIHAQSGKWQAFIVCNGKNKGLGLFANQREAAEAYNAAAVEFYKEFARLNIFED
jgi:hypothetical protein